MVILMIGLDTAEVNTDQVAGSERSVTKVDTLFAVYLQGRMYSEDFGVWPRNVNELTLVIRARQSSSLCSLVSAFARPITQSNVRCCTVRP